jgi:hypothetical protein
MKVSNMNFFDHYVIVLSLPTVHYSAVENMIRIETIPGIVYKYTLDGSIPTYNSATCIVDFKQD